MIATQEIQRSESTDVWTKLAAPLPPSAVSWRQDGRPVARDGRFVARFVAYVDAQTVRERLDVVVPGEWNLTLEPLPPLPPGDEDPTTDWGRIAFKARLQILGVVREDVGTGRDYKQAATDAFKRAGMRFGIGHELYQLGQNWVQVDGDGRFARPLEDPQVAHDRGRARESADAKLPALTLNKGASDVPPCPKCGGRMWDNRLAKRNPRAPDFKCRDRSCDGVIWPPKPEPKAGLEEPDAGATEAALGDAAV